MMKILKQTLLTGAVLAAFMGIHERAFADSFGYGASSCRDYLNADKLHHDVFEIWLGGYLNGRDDSCRSVQFFSKRTHSGNAVFSCLGDRVRSVPGVGASFDGVSNYTPDLGRRVTRVCSNNPDQLFRDAATAVISQLDRDYKSSD